MAIVAASLEAHNDWWSRTRAYDRLDPSEKRAASYFLGMAQAQLACAEVLKVPSLVHVDSVLAALGSTSRQRRPDFLGIDPVQSTLSVAVEAKGRTQGLDEDALAGAKIQAKSLPTITGVGTTMVVASMAYFHRGIYETRPIWRSRLEDPPQVRHIDDLRISRNALIALHYLPITTAVRSAQREESGAFVRSNLPDMDAWLWVPVAMVASARTEVDTEDPRELGALGADLASIAQESLSDVAGRELFDHLARSDRSFFLGQNAVGVELGSSWLEHSSFRL